MSQPLLSVSHLSKSYQGVKAVTDVSFSLVRGELMALIGPNGAGKSTCFNMLNGQIKPDAGSVVLDGLNTSGLSPARIFRLGVGRTFQIAEVYLSMTVRENVQVAILSHAGDLSGWTGFFGRLDRKFRREAEALIDLIGLGDHADRPCRELPYGDVKRLELAIALAGDPKLLLMDEPAAGMAPRERIELMKLTARIVEERQIGVLFTEHDMDIVFEHASRILVLNRGVIIAEGSPDAIRTNPDVQAVYLGSGPLYAKRSEG
ncbi:ABC transporter ATP-binding protein [Agrobacterium sp. SHOUNA12C]|uniref:ABC transporter ATP-binding protein n=1 Tax=Rhizobium rhizogenes NBRC 13257 TaxID=1220581 RepID=A0AA87Q4B8_RHIRH|nr:ABC transporter ATP-binding protein [Rhizobium rhizogenes]MCJ9720563.1 ABC transporter ATP-binding protein [Agrobacterium sp. BETTINA12B]MCJ9758534.1 ABC transporter ATP-binding protein [Agrobacterium sp. SHOUNA12C]NTF51445.1 ABC transporter ATP-binding protein [Rhizobium rhizogenes]NTF57979.1 ABC transporter ATP-binding protein [Rhizobium rhizogenes]NTF64398.1 ABC transporter ATP-binding protein [Rhizobium rhizogenes]